MRRVLAGFCLSLALFGTTLEAMKWSKPTDLSAPGKDAIAAQVAVGTKDNCFVIWSRYDGSQFVVQSAKANFGKYWLLPVNISEANGHALFAQIAMDQHDSPIAVWSQNQGTGYAIYASQWTPHGWSVPAKLSKAGSAGQNAATKPQLAIGHDGHTMVVWQQDNGINNVIQCVTRKKDKEWFKPENISGAVAGAIGDIDPQIALDCNNNALVVWVHTPTQTVQASYKSLDGRWSLPMNLSDGNTIVNHPQVAFDSYGNAIVVWEGSDGSNRIIQCANSTSPNSWTAPINLSNPGQNAVNPQLVVAPDGSATVVWQRSDGVNTIIQAATGHTTSSARVAPYQKTHAKTARTGPSWSEPVDLSIAGEDASEPQIHINAAGSVSAIWKRSDGANFIIQTTSLNSDGTWSLPKPLSDIGQDATRPQLALDTTGNILAVWERTDGQNTSVQASFGLIKK